MKELTKEFTCKYLLPCGHCDKFDKICDHNQPVVVGNGNTDIREILDTQTKVTICIHDWVPVNNINTAGYVYRCRKCGTMKTEPITRGLQEYISTTGNEEFNKNYSLWNSDSTDPCEHCTTNPKNGGSGVCHCILGLPQVTCGTLDWENTSSSCYCNNVSTTTATNNLSIDENHSCNNNTTLEQEPEQLTFNFKE